MENGSLKEDEVEEILRRRAICQGCEFMSENMEGAKQKSYSYCCNCSCPINSKTSALGARCGAAIYNERHPEDERPVLWERYKNN